MLVSWRYLANDSDTAVFKLYRDNKLIYTSNSSDATCYLDADGSASSTYRVDSVNGNTVLTSDTCTLISNNSYFDIPMDVPSGQTSGVTYSPNDCTVGDVDNDGQYEIFVKWDPSNSKDNSQKGYTDKVFIDCYELDGTKLWRIDLGINIRAGAHYTQMLVADFDSDGYAELMCKTADGTVDGQGNVIGDASADYRNSNGYILSGPEYYTLFDGATGKALDTVDYNPSRGTVKNWGDSYGNRVDRFLGAVAYLDGVHPSAVTIRGYYTRMTACAYDVVDKKIVQRWYFDTGNNSSAVGYGDGNHNCMPADVDGDGKQEIVLGGTCLDDDGTVLWNTNLGHGDAMHVGDFLPERDGLEVWVCHEDSPYGVSLLDAKTGETIFHYDGESDTGRCCADNVWSGNDGAEFWGLGNNVYDGTGTLLSCKRPAINFLSYWDGDLEREILDGYTDTCATIYDMGADGKLTTLLTTDGYYTCNTTKGTPCLSADLFGDWREELIVRASDSKSIRIYTTTYETDYRITTLMQDAQYRNQVAGQNVSYNQPPHASFYLGSDQPLPDRPNVTVLNGTSKPTVTTPTLEAATLVDGSVFMIQNVNSKLYLEVANGLAEAGANVQQWGASETGAWNTWRVLSAGDGYYYLYSQLGDTITYLLDVDYGSTADGTNIQIFTDTKADAQLFKFVKNDDGSYYILTKSSNDASALTVADSSTGSGANIVQSTLTNADSQKWTLTQVQPAGCTIDTSYTYQLKNVNSGLYLEVANGLAEDNANVQQWTVTDIGDWNTWKLVSAGNGYYYFYSLLGGGDTFLLDVNDGKSASGTNVQILQANQTSSQLFKLVANPDGSYNIVTKASKDKCALDVDAHSTEVGANVSQYTSKNATNQQWILEKVSPVVQDTTATTTTTVATTNTTTVTTTTSKPSTAVVTTTTTTATQPSDSSNTTVTTTTTAQPSDSSSTTEISTPNGIVGDVNQDGEVDSRDLLILKKYILGISDKDLSMNYDVNGDSSIDAVDVLTLKRILLKLS
jgi:rhamnogalacturonan endolyase